MADQVLDSEGQLVKLQSQLDRLGTSLQQWQQTQGHHEPMEGRLSQLLQQGGEILDRLKATDTRHANAVDDLEARLSEWRSMEGTFRERAKSLDDLCEAAAHAVNGIKQAESRLEELSSEMQAVVARGPVGPPVRSGSPVDGNGEAWPLDGVMRLHDDLRRQSGEALVGLPAARDEFTDVLAGRVESLEIALTAGQEELARAADRSARQRRNTAIALATLAIGSLAAGAIALGWQRNIDSRLNDATTRMTAAERQAETATKLADERVASAQRAAEQGIAEAQQTAQRAQIVSGVLAAPDLVRFSLPGGARAPRAFGQLLWSRSRGFVLSGSRVPAAPAGSQHHLWLLTSTRTVDAGTFAPDAQGRVTWVAGDLPDVPRPVIGAAVTVEPMSGSAARASAAAVRARALAVTPVPIPATVPVTNPGAGTVTAPAPGVVN